MDSMTEELLLTTQPGWAFATVLEIHTRGVESRVPFFHRDSSVVVPASPALIEPPLLTPAEIFGMLLKAEGSHSEDATAGLRQRLDPTLLKALVLHWLPRIRHSQPRRYSIASEVFGDTAVHRKALLNLVERTVRQAFPRWKRTALGGVRLLCKADPKMGAVGVQLHTNLGAKESPRPGTLRMHLACALLAIAQVQQGDAVFDPFMGTGTILAAAWKHFGVQRCIGCEIDAKACDTARRAVKATDARLHNLSFEDFEIGLLPRRITLVSNLPFGTRFARIPTDRLARFVMRLRDRVDRIILLAGREQAKELTESLDLRAKNVLVLGQQASILYRAS